MDLLAIPTTVLAGMAMGWINNIAGGAGIFALWAFQYVCGLPLYVANPSSRLGAIVRIVLPLSLAGMFTVAIFAFTLSMQDFVYALTFVSSSDQKVVTVGVVTELIRGDVFYWGSLMAGALIAGVPVAVLYTFFLDRFVAGITGGAVK